MSLDFGRVAPNPFTRVKARLRISHEANWIHRHHPLDRVQPRSGHERLGQLRFRFCPARQRGVGCTRNMAHAH